jgi:hypothetical protein
VVDAADELGEELAIEIREQHADGVSTTGAETPCRAVRTIGEPGRRATDAAPRLLGDVAALVERAGRRSHRHARRAGNLSDRDHDLGSKKRVGPRARESTDDTRVTAG